MSRGSPSPISCRSVLLAGRTGHCGAAFRPWPENLQRTAGPSIPRSSRKSARLWSVSGAGMLTPFSFAMTGLNMRASIIARYPLALAKDLDGSRCQPHLHLAAGKTVGHAVEMTFELDVVIDTNPADAPFRKAVGLR